MQTQSPTSQTRNAPRSHEASALIELSNMLDEYREGERGLPSYSELEKLIEKGLQESEQTRSA